MRLLIEDIQQAMFKYSTHHCAIIHFAFSPMIKNFLFSVKISARATAYTVFLRQVILFAIRTSLDEHRLATKKYKIVNLKNLNTKVIIVPLQKKSNWYCSNKSVQMFKCQLQKLQKKVKEFIFRQINIKSSRF